MGWTYEDYMSQPTWFIERMKLMKRSEEEYEELKNRNSN